MECEKIRNINNVQQIVDTMKLQIQIRKLAFADTIQIST